MNRLWGFFRRRRDDQAALDIDLDRAETGLTERYATRPVRPLAQRAVRVGVWVAVGLGGLGGLGGLVGLLRPSGTEAEPAAAVPRDRTEVPASVAGVAERAAEAWLTATSDDEVRLAELYVNPPSIRGVDTEEVAVGRVTTIGGERLEDGYWTVTVAADVVDTPAPAAETDGGAEVARATTWYLELGVTGEANGRLRALETPAVVPEPSSVSVGWSRSDDDSYTPEQDDAVVATVEGFLDALLTGQGDPARYLTPGLEVAALDSPPFADLSLERMALDDLEGGEVVVWTHAGVTTAGGARRTVAYELLVARRQGRWEIIEFGGAPTFIERDRPDSVEPPSTALGEE